ncbi:carbohydrate binding domain-containing protein [Deinococcus sp. JMULE3]|uniref:carbohydrate binding domain-containing protein n=1 Tax=Deinococcus sp. JMULE3 TaxID=2518341 RepID=UPI0015755075|nr:family 16 glycosylhydrolase [Deinococcus sp. JMULE3]NTX99750.1 glycosyl hydrolase family protein [Deinococcus sp. JMULE3]
MPRSPLPILLPVTLLLGACNLTGASTATPVWADEFNGTQLDTSKWSYQTGNGFMNGNDYVAGWGNNELEYYTDRASNVSVQGGNLVITAKKEQFTGPTGNTTGTFDWTSGRVRTAGKFSRTYGRFEIRAKFPRGKGFWPAVWMLPETPSPYPGWAANGEIDIAEGWGSKPTELAQTIHYGGVWPNNVYKGETVTFANGGTMDQWHTYAVEWTPGKIQWFIDGKLTSEKTQWWSAKNNPPTSDADLNAWPAPFDKPFHLLLNLAVGGNFDGNPDATTPDQGQMLVDYVRVYGMQNENGSAGPKPDMTYPWTPRPARPALPDGNLVYNGSFDLSDTDPLVTPDATSLSGVNNSKFWTMYTSDGQVTLSNDAGALKADITNAGSVAYAVQVRQDGLNIELGGKYEVSFDAWAQTARPVTIKVGGGPDRGYAAYSGEKTVQLGTTKARQTLTFDMSATSDAAARLEFNLGNAGTGPVWIDNVVIKRVGNAAGARPPAADGNLLYNAAFTQDATATVPGIAGVPGSAYWSTWSNVPERLSTSVSGGTVTLNVTNVDPSNNWHVQLNQTNVPVTAGKSYTLTFKGKATDAREVAVVIGENGGSFTRYLDGKAALTGTEQTFTYTFTAPVTNIGAQFQILGAVGAAGSNYGLSFRDFRLVQNP